MKIRRRTKGECFAKAYISTAETPPREDTRVPRAYEDQGWPQSAGGTPQEGPSSPHARVMGGQPISRFGFSIKKALGGAVVRNRMRRRLREIVRCHRQEITSGWDIVIHPKQSVATAPMPALTADFLRMLKGL